MPAFRLALVALGLLLASAGGAYAQDCNLNGVADATDIALGTSDDCDGNAVPDECDIAGGAADCNLNGIIDGCEPVGPDLPAPAGGFASVSSVAIRGDYAVVGSAAALSGAGTAHVFRRVGTIWVEDGAPLVAAGGAAGDAFGASVAIDGDLIAVGAPGADVGATDAGAVYVFRRIAGSWLEEDRLSLAVPSDADELGAAVAVSGARILAGAPMTAAASSTGRAAVYFHDGSTWSLEADLIPAGLADGDEYGSAVSLAPTRAYIGAPGRQSGATPGAGEAFVFALAGSWSAEATLAAPVPASGALFGASIAGTDASLAVGAGGESSPEGRVHTFERSGAVWSFAQTLAPPASPLGATFGVGVAMSAEFLLVGEEEAGSTPGRAHVYRRDAGAWSFDATLSEGALGNLYGAAVSTEGRYGIVAAPGTPGAVIHWIDEALDCNTNGIDDVCDIASGFSTDCNLNGIPDSCEGLTDTTPPVISNLPANIAVNSTPGLCSAVVSWTAPTASDNCLIDTFTSNRANGSSFGLGTTTVVYTATDTAGNVTTASFTVTVSDVQNPFWSNVPTDIVASVDAGLCGAAVSWTAPLANDNCAVFNFSSSHTPGNFFPVGTTTVTYSATDISGNLGQVTFLVTVTDDEDPAIAGNPVTVLASSTGGTCGAIVTWTAPTATDNCGIASLVASIPPGSSFPVGDTLVTYTATDVNGNVALADLTVTVEDDTAPSLAGVPSDIAVDADPLLCSATATWTPPTATDDCGSASVSGSHAPGATFPVGVTTVTYTATDAAGNSAPASFTVTVADTEIPTWTFVPADIAATAPLGSCGANVSWTPPTANDNCAVQSSSSTAASNDFFPVGATIVTYTATDASGNVGVASFTVTVSETEPPAIVGLPAPIVAVSDAGTCGTVVSWTAPTATDNCGVASLVPSIVPGSFFPVGVTTVTYTATDVNGNVESQGFTVTVNDATPPTLIGIPSNITVPAAAGLCTAAVSWTPPTGADDCALQGVTSSHSPGSVFPLGTTTVTYTATDTAGNATSQGFTVTVVDVVPPAIVGAPADISVSNDPGLCGAAVSWTLPSATDLCSTPTLGSDFASGAIFPVGATLVTYTATDAAGNVATASFTVTVADTEPPLVSGTPADISVNAAPGTCAQVASWIEPTASDNCAVASFAPDFAPGSSFPVGVTTVTYTATDPAGNSQIASFTVTVVDTQPPTVSGLPAPISVSASPGTCAATVSWTAPTASDNCSVASLVPSHTPGTSFPVGTTTVTYTATDASGNATPASFTVTVSDVELPVISGVPAPISVPNAPGTCAAVVTWGAPTASDNCSVASLTPSSASGSSFPVGITTVTYTATDAAGNTSQASFTVTVSDIQSPVIVGTPSDITVPAAAGECAAIVSWTEPTANENCALQSFVADASSGSSFPVGSTSVTYTATDVAGNVATSSFTVTVEDLQLPAIAGLPADIVAPAEPGACSASVTWAEPTATDNCAIANFSASAPSGTTFPVGTTTVTYTATDSAGNVSSLAFTVTVADTQPPAIAGVPAGLTATAEPGTCAAIVTWPAPTATDNCSLASLAPDLLPGTSYPVGTTTVTYTATDDAGNSSTASFDITVTDDEDPVIAGIPADISVTTPGGQSTAVVTWTQPTATDNCTLASLTPDIPSGSTFVVGVTQVTYTAVDIHGNSSTASFNVSVTDNEAPVIAGVPADILVTADPGACSTTVTWTPPTATDNTVVVSFAPNIPSGSTFPVGTTVVTYTATDDSGNSSSASFDVIVSDDELPVISGTPSPVVLPASAGTCARTVTWTAPTATDNCALASLAPNIPSGSSFPVGTTTVVFTATDASGNAATTSFTVTIEDLQLPSLTGIPSNLTLNSAPGTCAASATWTPPVASDNCTIASLTSNRAPGSSFAVGTTTVTYVATDASGNSTNASFTVTVVDAEQPIITSVPANITRAADPGTCSATVLWTAPSATDNCSLASFTANAVSGSSFPVGVTPVTYIATDSAGNFRTATFVISVIDTEDPVITGLPGNITTSVTPGTCSATVLWATPTASDNCALASFGSSIASGSSFPVGVTPVTYVATDTAGNVTSSTFLVTVIDNQAPAIAGVPSNITVPSAPGSCSAVVTWVEPSATDACGTTTLTTNRPSGSTFPVGTTTVTYTATDGANITIATFSVTVVDAQPPAISGLPLSFTVSAIPGGCGATVSWPQPSATDNCSLASLTSDRISGATFPVGTTVVTYTATDDAGNSAQASFSFTVTDDEDPTLTGMPANRVVSTSGGLCTAVSTWTAPTASDNCGAASLSSSHSSGASFPLGVTVVTYTATDAGGNTRTASFTVTVIDGEAPVLSGVPADIAVTNSAGLCGAVVTWAQPTATDSCSAVSVSSDIPSGSTFPLGTTTVTYTASDGPNQTVATFTVTVTDGQAPTITNVPSNIAVTAAPGTCSATAVWIPPLAADNCALLSLVPNFPSGASFPLGTTTVSYTATDVAGNESVASFTVTVTDDQDPTITGVPSNVTAFTSGGTCSAVATWTAPTANDNCGPASLSSNFAPGTSFPVGVHTVTYTAIDPSGNSSSASFTVAIVDGDPPVISNVPADISVASTPGSCGAIVTWTAPTATDACASASVTPSIASGSFFPVGTTTVTFTATDGGNSSTASFTVTVNDAQAPAISGLPAPITAPAAAGTCAATVTWTAPTASDNCSVASLVPSHASGSSFPIGVTTVTYTATDAAGNATPASFTVTVVDTQPPQIAGVPANVTVSTTGGLCTAAATWTAPTASDNCGSASVTGSHTPGASFPVGVTTVTYTATDGAGNSSAASFTVTVVDGGAPVIAGMPANITTTSAPGLCSAPATWTAPTATDACGTVTLTSDFASGSSFPVGTTTVTYTASDGGNSSTASFTVTVLDGQDPAIVGLPAPITLFALPGSCTASAVWAAPSATDNCAVASLVPNIPSGSSFPVGETTIVYTATDAAGNDATASFTVTVLDGEDPEIDNVPANIVATASPGVGSAVVSWTAPTATDNCALSSLVADHPPGSTFAIGVTTVTYTATDAAGNTATASFTVTVSDNQSPVISGVPANISVPAAAGTCSATVSWTAPTASDNGVLVSFLSNHLPGDSFPVGTTTVLYTAIDDASNVTTASFSITVVDAQAPLFTGVPASIVIAAAPGTCSNSVSWTPPVATDNCSLSNVIASVLPGTNFPVGTTTVSYTATDAAGNDTTVSFTVTVQDTQLPTILGMPANIVVPTAGGLCTATATWAAPVAFDNCGVQGLTATASSGSSFPVGVTTVTYTATDANGNVRNASFTVTVVDGGAPVIAGMPANIVAPSSTGLCGAVVSWVAPTASDACGVATLSSSHPSGATFPVGTTLVTYTASDGANSSTASFTVTVFDDEDPLISGVPSNLTVPVQAGLCSATVTWTSPVATDNCTLASLTVDRPPGSTFAVGTTPVFYLATDAAGNTRSATFDVTVVDDQRPVISGVPTPITLTTVGGLCTATASWTSPTATDNCTLASLTSNFPSGSAFSVGVTTVTYTALDLAGNSATSSFTVTVSDAQPPVISSVPPNITLPASAGTCARAVTWTPPTAADACGVATLSSTHSPGASFPVGTTTVVYTASDGANSSQASFTVTVTDNQAPTIVGLPTNLSVPAAAGGCNAVVTWTAPTAADNCGGATVQPNIAPGSTFPLGNTPVSYLATDLAGNTTFGTFIVTVFDAQAPVISGVPANITVSAATGTCSRNVSWTPPTASDLCGSTNLSASIPPGASFPAGTTTVSYTATDLAGNTATASFTVTVLDQNPPVLIGVPGSQVLTVAPGACTATAIWSDPIGLDPCGAVAVTSSHPSGTAFPVGTTAVTYTATDLSGNIATGVFGITVVDNTGPVASGVPTNIVTSVAAGTCSRAVTWVEPTFTDGCGVASTIRSHTPGQVFPLGATTVTYTVSDTNGNTTVTSFGVTVTDFVGPTIQGIPADIVIPNTTGQCSATVTWTQPTASDPCGVASLTSNFSSGSVLAAGVTTVIYTAVDNNGNVSTASFTITIQDQIAPVLVNVPASFSVPAAPGFCGTVPTWQEPLAVDNCGILTSASDVALGSFFPLGTTTVTYTATDLNDNTVTASFDITVEDSLPPVFSTIPDDILLTLAPGTCSQVVNWTPPIAADPCGLASLTASLDPGAVLGAGTTTVTYTAIDDNGNSATASFDIVIVDPEPPVLSAVPANISTTTSTTGCGAAVTWTPPTASDNCGGVELASDFEPGASFPVGVTTVTYSATDTSGNITLASFSVTVVDDDLPTIPNLPAGVSVNTSNNQCQATVTWSTPVAADNCGVASLVGSHSPATSFPVGTTTVTYTVTDTSGNVANLSFPVTVVDDDAPTVSGLPLVLNVQAAPGVCGANVNWPNPITADNCGVVSLTSTHAPGSFFPIGTTVVTYTASDASGNQGTRNLTITVNDNQLPVISGLPANISVPNAAGQCFATVSWTPPTATDNCGIQSFSSTNAPGSLFPIGQTPVTYTAIDVNGGIRQSSFIVTVSDDQDPVLTPSGNIVLPALPGACSAIVSVPIPSASDNCNLISVTNDANGTGDASGEYPFGTTAVTWTAIDEYGNVTTAIQTITVTVPLGNDCNGNGIPDLCDLSSGTSADCDQNGLLDECDIAADPSIDVNGDGVIDSCESTFRRADMNDDGNLNIADAIFLLQTLFIGGSQPPCLDAADANDDGFIDISDVIFTINYIFAGGAPPAAPFPGCGLDPTGGDPFGCATSQFCP